MSEREAQELVAKADKKATSSSWFFGGNKYEESAELYTKAANIFKMAKRCKQAHHVAFSVHQNVPRKKKLARKMNPNIFIL